MKASLLTITSLLLFSLFTFAQDTTIILTPTDDVFSTSNGFRNNEELRLKYGKQRAYLKFDLSHIEGDVKTAHLELTSKARTYISDLFVNIGDRTNWEESTIPLSNKPLSSVGIGSLDGPGGGFRAGVTYAIKLDSSKISIGEQMTLIVSRKTGSSQPGWSSVNVFHSKESVDSNTHPKLILTINGTVIPDTTDTGGGNNDDDGDDDTIADNIWSIQEDGIIYYNGGNVGIGTSTPLTAFAVNGEIRATKVRVRGDINLPDYVFEEDYELRPLEAVENYIEQNGHLPDIPSAEEVEKEGLSLGDMDATLLRKVEELTLYLIEMKKENEQLRKEVDELKQQLKDQ